MPDAAESGEPGGRSDPAEGTGSASGQDHPGEVHVTFRLEALSRLKSTECRLTQAGLEEFVETAVRTSPDKREFTITAPDGHAFSMEVEVEPGNPGMHVLVLKVIPC